jgi:hypothetical protein
MLIRYLKAESGKVVLSSGGREDTIIAASNSAEELAAAMKEYGLDSSLLNSSSMDFASEYGFDYDYAAWDLFDAALTLAGYELEY